LWRKLTKFLRLPFADQRLYLEALFALGRARLMLANQPFQKIAERIGQPGTETSTEIPEKHDQLAERIGLAVSTMANHTPWDCRCLAQALAAWQMLQRRGIAATVYFGVAPNPEKPFDAHAWLRCGSRLVTGGYGHEQFRVISSFALQRHS